MLNLVGFVGFEKKQQVLSVFAIIVSLAALTSKGNLAFHLGLVVPTDGKSVLSVGDEEAVEADGKVVIFDATHTHSAYSRQPENRTILYIDFEISNAKEEAK